jgi:predicted phosphatase
MKQVIAKEILRKLKRKSNESEIRETIIFLKVRNILLTNNWNNWGQY